MDPYIILGVPPQASDSDIRKAYLEGVRRFPPEQAPERFQEISAAYETIRDEAKRLKLLLFDQSLPGTTPLDTVANFCASSATQPMKFEQMKAFLRSCTTTTTTK